MSQGFEFEGYATTPGDPVISDLDVVQRFESPCYSQQTWDLSHFVTTGDEQAPLNTIGKPPATQSSFDGYLSPPLSCATYLAASPRQNGGEDLQRGPIAPEPFISNLASPTEMRPFSPVAQFDHDYYIPGVSSDPISSPVEMRTIVETKTEHTSSEEASIGSTDSNSHLREKRTSQRQRNRIAASKCRRKYKQQEDDLAKRERELATKHKVLSDSAMALKNEVFDLKYEILKHGSCNCSVIDDYIARAARELPRVDGSTR